MSQYNPIHIPGRTERELNAQRVARLAVGYDPGPGVAEVERFQEQIEAGRRANRPPEAPIPGADWAEEHVEAPFASIEDRLRMVVDERNRLQERVRSLHVALDHERERTGVREVVLLAELRAEQRDCRRGYLLAVALFIALVWREGYHAGMWLWRML